MEVKLSHCRVLYLQNPKLLATRTFQSLSKISFKKHIRDLTLKWRIQLEEISQYQVSTNSSFTHVVKEGETLTSISKLYGISIYSIAAANKNILGLDLVFIGQHLKIPTSAPMVCLQKKILPQSLRNVLDGFSSEKVFTMLTTHHLPLAKTTGYFLVLVPLIAFCIRCIISAVHTQVAKKKTGEVGTSGSESKSQRWRSALSDISDPDNLQSVSRPASSNVEDDEEQVSSKELSLAYERLQHDYEKFLSQCGMSRWGHWRGGDSPD